MGRQRQGRRGLAPPSTEVRQFRLAPTITVSVKLNDERAKDMRHCVFASWTCCTYKAFLRLIDLKKSPSTRQVVKHLLGLGGRTVFGRDKQTATKIIAQQKMSTEVK